MQGIHWLAEDLLAPQEGLSSMDLFIYLGIQSWIVKNGVIAEDEVLFWQWSASTDKNHKNPSRGSCCQRRRKTQAVQNKFSGRKGNQHSLQIWIFIVHEGISQYMEKTTTEKGMQGVEDMVGYRVMILVISCQNKVQPFCCGLSPVRPSCICQMCPYFSWEHPVGAGLPTPLPLPPHDESNSGN